MEKTIYSDSYRHLCRMLKARRSYLGMRQIELATALGVSQTFVSKYEKAERRLDVCELDAICTALGLSLIEVITEFRGFLEAHESA